MPKSTELEERARIGPLVGFAVREVAVVEVEPEMVMGEEVSGREPAVGV